MSTRVARMSAAALAGLALVTGTGCPAEPSVNNVNGICQAFADIKVKGICVDTPTIFVSIGINPVTGTVYDSDPTLKTINPTATPTDAEYPLRDANVDIVVDGGLPAGTSTCGEKDLAVCVGPDCEANYPAGWVRGVSTKTGGNGVLAFSIAVGYWVSGTVSLEFDRATCEIPVSSAASLVVQGAGCVPTTVKCNQ